MPLGNEHNCFDEQLAEDNWIVLLGKSSRLLFPVRFDRNYQVVNYCLNQLLAVREETIQRTDSRMGLGSHRSQGKRIKASRGSPWKLALDSLQRCDLAQGITADR